MIFWELFWTFFKIGAFTFGGGYAMLPLIQAEVASHGWMSGEELVNFIAVSESSPGPFAINCATFVGTVTGGIPGAVCATLGVVLPSFLIILLVAKFFSKFRQNRYVSACMSGLKPAVIGLIAAALISVSQTVFFPSGISAAAFCSPWLYISLAVFALMVILAFKKVHPIVVILLSAAIGIVAGYSLPLFGVA